jgi:DNA cross-link repair 1A protein
VVGLTEAATREQNPVSDESELLNDIKSDGGVEVVDLTEGGKKEHNLGAETEHDRGNREAELGAQEQNLNARARLTVGVCRHKVIADEGTEATEGMVSAAHVPEDGTTVTLGTGRSTDHQYSERASDSSTTFGSSKGLNASLRRLYRSMNVLVSRPLPSLVQLTAASKRPRVSQTAQL